jgi:hypothetical protein
VSFVILLSGVWLQIAGSHSGSSFAMLSPPLNYIGVLAAWFGRSVKQQSDRLDHIEAVLQGRDST